MRLRWTEQALVDVRKIDAWLSLNVEPAHAEETLESIRRQANSLLQFPRRKPRIRSAWHYSRVEKTSYVLIYAVTKGLVTVMRVHHSRADWRS